MASSTVSLASDVGAAARIQAIAAALFGSFAAGGLVQTGDTGQTANESFSTVAGANTPAGYQIWRFADDLQEACPVFFKIELGAGASNNVTFGFWVTIGTGSDGAGNITGILMARTAWSVNNSVTSLPASYFSSSVNRVNFALFIGIQSPTYDVIFNLERSKDNNGSDTSDGIIIQVQAYTNTKFSQYIPFSRSARAGQNAFAAAPQSALGSLASGSNVGMLPLYPVDITGPVNPGMGLLAYYTADLTVMNPIRSSIYGADHMYVPLGAASTATSGWTGSCLAMRYE
jgi:hypothetical protein